MLNLFYKVLNLFTRTVKASYSIVPQYLNKKGTVKDLTNVSDKSEFNIMSIFHSVINNKTKLSKLYFFGTDEDTYLKNYNIFELSKPWKLRVSTKISRKSETFFTKNSKEIGSFLFFKWLIFITPWKWNFFSAIHQ